MSKHTPGPWMIDGWSVYSESAQSEDGKPHNYFSVAEVSDRGGQLVRRTIPKEEASANARLISEAPAFYEAAKMLEDLMTNWAGDFRIEAKDMVPTMLAGEMIAKFRSAIARAEGKNIEASESEPDNAVPSRKED
jgi:hypothetical protein